MYIVPVEVKASPIEGQGVFAKRAIPKGTIVWKYQAGHDSKMSVDSFNRLDTKTREALEKVSYLSEQSGMWVAPAEDDPARFTNHNQHPNITTIFDAQISDEPVFVATRDILAGEEITNNYLDFDTSASTTTRKWLK